MGYILRNSIVSALRSNADTKNTIVAKRRAIVLFLFNKETYLFIITNIVV